MPQHRRAGCNWCREPGCNRVHDREYTIDRVISLGLLPADRWATHLAGLMGVNRRTCHRWRHEGLTYWQADRIALAVGCHPSQIWPSWVADGLRVAA